MKFKVVWIGKRVRVMLACSIPKYFALGLVLMIGCTKPSGKPRPNTRDDRKGNEASASAGRASSDYLLDLGDIEKFRIGRSKDEILADVQWRGNLEMATRVEGREVCGISFGLFGGPFGDDSRGTILWAVFVDDRFKKFVDWPAWNDKPLAVGDFRELILALEGAPVNIGDLAKEEKRETPKQVDPALTIAVLPFMSAVAAAHARSVEKNAKLRDQFNASRLRLDMSEGEVEIELRAEPIEFGEFGDGSWRLYGSTDPVDVLDHLKYSNILVLFESGKVTGIYSGSTVRGGADGLRALRQPTPVQGIVQRPSFSDLPPSAARPK